MDKKTIIAAVVSIIILLSFDVVMKKFYPHLYTKKSTTITTEGQAPSEFSTVPQTSTQQASTAVSTPTYNNTIDYSKGDTLLLENNRLLIELSTIGGGITKIIYKDTQDNEKPHNTTLVETTSNTPGLFTISKLQNTNASSTQVFKVTQQSNTLILLSANLSNDFKITKKYYLPENSEVLETSLIFGNNSTQEIPLSYELINNIQSTDLLSRLDMRYCQAISLVDGKKKKVGFEKLLKKPLTIPGEIAWSSLKSKYFSKIVKPQLSVQAITSTPAQNNIFFTQFIINDYLIPANSSLEHTFISYYGPNDFEQIASYKIDGIEKSLSGGFIWYIGQLLLKVLRLFEKIFHNWGVSIILLTMIISTGLFPFTRKSFESMKKMQQLQPKVDTLKKQYKDDPQKLNKETMELWRKHKINPLSGCLPMIPQMIVLFSLFSVLVSAVDLKGAHFLWIQDLSRPDNFFKLPFTLPLIGNYINLLPLATMVTMFLQQNINKVKTSTDSQQKMMTTIMPIMMGVIFYKFPAGCLLYFLTSNAMTIFFQSITMKK